MKIECLVDNAVQQGSRLWGKHGLAFLVESDAGRLLFDPGASGTVLLHNLEAAGVAIATSTWHCNLASPAAGRAKRSEKNRTWIATPTWPCRVGRARGRAPRPTDAGGW